MLTRPAVDASCQAFRLPACIRCSALTAHILALTYLNAPSVYILSLPALLYLLHAVSATESDCNMICWAASCRLPELVHFDMHMHF